MAIDAFIISIGRELTVRLRPILMTSIALVAGMLPIAIGLNEACSHIERFRVWNSKIIKRKLLLQGPEHEV